MKVRDNHLETVIFPWIVYQILSSPESNVGLCVSSKFLLLITIY